MAAIKAYQTVAYVVSSGRVETVSVTQTVAYVLAPAPPAPPPPPPPPPVNPPPPTTTPPPPFTPDDAPCSIGLSFATLKTTVLKMLGEDTTTPVYWTSDECGRYINDAYREFAKETGCLETWESIAITANTGSGTLSDFVGPIMRVVFDDRRLESTTNFELDRLESNWENRVGYVSNYVLTGRGNKTITVYKQWDGTAYVSDGPWSNDGNFRYSEWATGISYSVGDRVTRQDSTSGRLWGYVCLAAHASDTTNAPSTGASASTYWQALSLTVWCKKVPALLSADTDTPSIPCWAHLGLAFRAAAKALAKYGEQRNPQTAASYDALALDYLKLLKGYMALRQPEKVDAMGPTNLGNQLRKPRPWDRVIS